MLVWPEKDPDEVATRFLDWSSHRSWIAGDSIITASFSLVTAAGMTINGSDDNGVTISQVTLSGGTADSRGKVLGEVVTTLGQTIQQSATILIRAN